MPARSAVSDERSRMWSVSQDGAVSGGPDGPLPVQRGDVVMVYIAKSWSEAAERLRNVNPNKSGQTK